MTFSLRDLRQNADFLLGDVTRRVRVQESLAGATFILNGSGAISQFKSSLYVSRAPSKYLGERTVVIDNADLYREFTLPENIAGTKIYGARTGGTLK